MHVENVDPEESGFLEAGLRPIRPGKTEGPANVIGQNNCGKCGKAVLRQWNKCEHCGNKLKENEPNEGSLSHGVTTDSQDGVEPGKDWEEEDEDCREEGEEGRNPVAVREVVKVSQKEKEEHELTHTHHLDLGAGIV